MASGIRFNDKYKELVRLQSGAQICLRLIHSNDKQHISRAFNELSPESRYRRFLGAKKALTTNDLRYFTDIDQFDHFALAALNLDVDQNEVGLAGIARFIRLQTDPQCAEVGITVIDHSQGKGIGRNLLERLLSAATERGIKRLRFECLSENLDIQRLVRKLNKHVKFIREHDLLIAQIEIPKQVSNTHQYPLDIIDELSALIRAFSSGEFILYADLSIKMLKQSLSNAHHYTKIHNKKLVQLLGKSRTDKA